MQGKSKRTKSAEILDLYAQGLSTKEIAERVGCQPAYVRVVTRQRRGAQSRADMNYLEKAKSVLGEGVLARIAREEYRRQRDLGASTQQALQARSRARTRAICAAARRASEATHA